MDFGCAVKIPYVDMKENILPKKKKKRARNRSLLRHDWLMGIQVSLSSDLDNAL